MYRAKAPTLFLCCALYIRPPTLFLCCALFGTEGRTDTSADREKENIHTWEISMSDMSDRRREKQLEARALTFGGTEGSMLGRRGWFDALSKVRCWEEGDGSMLCQRIWFDAENMGMV